MSEIGAFIHQPRAGVNRLLIVYNSDINITDLHAHLYVLNMQILDNFLQNVNKSVKNCPTPDELGQKLATHMFHSKSLHTICINGSA